MKGGTLKFPLLANHYELKLGGGAQAVVRKSKLSEPAEAFMFVFMNMHDKWMHFAFVGCLCV